MDEQRFDGIARALDSRLTRRGASAAALAALATIGLAVDAGAKKHKKKKPSYKCSNLGTGCANGTVCQCRISTGSANTCGNVVQPPNGIAFLTCLKSTDCGKGQFCDLATNFCLTGCRTN